MQRASSLTVVSLTFGVALGALFVALFIAAAPAPLHDLLRRSDAVIPLLLLVLHTSGLFGCVLFAGGIGQEERESGRGTRQHARRRGTGGTMPCLRLAALPARRGR